MRERKVVMMLRPVSVIKNEHPNQWVVIRVSHQEGSIPDRGQLLYASDTLDEHVGLLIADDQDPQHDIIVDYSGPLAPEGAVLIL